MTVVTKTRLIIGHMVNCEQVECQLCWIQTECDFQSCTPLFHSPLCRACLLPYLSVSCTSLWGCTATFSLCVCVYYPFLRGSFCKTGTGSLYFWAYGSFFTHHLFLCLNQKEAFVSGACLLYRSLTLYGLDCRTRVSTSQHPTCWLIGVPQVWSLVKMIQRTWEGVFMNTSGWLQRIHLRNSQMEDMHRAREEWRQGWVLLVPTFPASDGFTYSLKSVVLSFYGCAIAKTLLVKCLTIQFLSQSQSPPWQ